MTRDEILRLLEQKAKTTNWNSLESIKAYNRYMHDLMEEEEHQDDQSQQP